MPVESVNLPSVNSTRPQLSLCRLWVCAVLLDGRPPDRLRDSRAIQVGPLAFMCTFLYLPPDNLLHEHHQFKGKPFSAQKACTGR